MLLSKDKEAHIVLSCVMTLISKPILKSVVPVLFIGAIVETVDWFSYGRDTEHCLKDMTANLAGVGMGLITIKLLTCKNLKK